MRLVDVDSETKNHAGTHETWIAKYVKLLNDFAFHVSFFSDGTDH